jgi:alpha-galactosidase
VGVSAPAPVRIRVRATGRPADERPFDGSVDVGGVRLDTGTVDDVIHWSVTAPDEAVYLDAVALVWDAGPATDDARLFAQGYQSWSPTRTLRLGRDRDPTLDPRGLSLVHAAFHADPGRAADGELRSEQVAVLTRAGMPALCAGLLGGDRHAGTIRARIVDDRVEMCVEAWLGGARLQPGSRRTLHEIALHEGDDPAALLGDWARRVGRAAGARVDAPFVVGWCSWYQYFDGVTEALFTANLARADAFPFELFQLDDGYQHAIGDWVRTNDRFPSGVDGVASKIRAAGRTPGIWLAPFLAAPESELARAHPEWLVRAPAGEGFAIGMYNEVWGGAMAMLDTTRADVLDHLARTAAALAGAGYRYLKLDFTFSAAMPGVFADPTRTPAERVRAGFDAIRRGAGDDVFILGCGAPLGAVVGVVDGMRIGADVAPWWDPPPGRGEQMPGYEAAVPSTHNAYVNTCTRSFMHRTLWSNDPDCIMLRTADTELAPEAAERWARTVGGSGGLVLVSDDLALLGPRERRLLDEVIAGARAADAAARAGRPPRCAGLFELDDPAGLRS